MNLPLNFVVDRIYENCKRVKRRDNSYNFECPVCGEGKSAGKKRRGFYFTAENYFFCQNCQRSWSTINWIIEVERSTFKDVVEEARKYDNTVTEVLMRKQEPVVKKNAPSLPYDSINLFDPIQLQYYRSNEDVQRALKYINSRRLNTAINRPKAFYMSLTDFIHKNRLCIPFYDADGKIVYYQSRAITPQDEDISRYLCKKDSDKTLYGVHSIDPSLEYIFIFEGPIDSMFCKNGVAVCGLTMTDTQEQQLNQYKLFERIWILDNQLSNQNVYDNYIKLVKRGERVFVWPQELQKYKDLNELCVDQQIDSISPNLFIRNSYTGLDAKLKIMTALSQT